MKWKHHGYLLAQRAVNTLKVHIVLHEPLFGLLFLCIGFQKMFRKIIKNTEPTGPKLLSDCFIGAMVCVPHPAFFAVFRRLRTKLMRRENDTKLKKLTFDLNLLLAPSFFFFFFFLWVLEGATSSKQLKNSTRALLELIDVLNFFLRRANGDPTIFFSVIGMLPIGGFKNRFLFLGPTLAQTFLVAANW